MRPVVVVVVVELFIINDLKRKAFIMKIVKGIRDSKREVDSKIE